MLEEGDKVPTFELQDSNGDVVKSSSFKGKKFVVYFYPRDFTPGCTIEADEFSKEYKKFQKIGVQIVGISTDDVESHKKFVDKMKKPKYMSSVVLKGLKKVSQLSSEHPVKKFVVSRKIPNKYHATLFSCPNFMHFVNSLVPDKFSNDSLFLVAVVPPATATGSYINLIYEGLLGS